MEPLFVAKPGGMRWVNPLLAGMVMLTVVLTGVLLAFADTTGALITGATLLATTLLIWLILPRRYEIWPDHLRLVFPVWSWSIPFETIHMVREGQWYEAYGFIGVRFATSPTRTITVLRHKPNLFTRPNLVISPEDRDEFLARLRRAMA